MSECACLRNFALQASIEVLGCVGLGQETEEKMTQIGRFGAVLLLQIYISIRFDSS